MRKFVIVIILFILHSTITYYTHSVGKDYYSQRIEAGNINPKVYDISHKYLPNLSDDSMLPILTNIFMISPLILHPSATPTLLKYFLPLFALRHLTTMVTILPKHKSCDDTFFGLDNIIFGHCYDKVFSGHMSFTVLISLVLSARNIYPPIYLWIYNIIMAFLIITLRWHYTVDIILGIVLSFAIYNTPTKLI